MIPADSRDAYEAAIEIENYEEGQDPPGALAGPRGETRTYLVAKAEVAKEYAEGVDNAEVYVSDQTGVRDYAPDDVPETDAHDDIPVHD